MKKIFEFEYILNGISHTDTVQGTSLDTAKIEAKKLLKNTKGYLTGWYCCVAFIIYK